MTENHNFFLTYFDNSAPSRLAIIAIRNLNLDVEVIRMRVSMTLTGKN